VAIIADDVDTGLILALMGQQKPRIPISGMEGPNGELFYAEGGTSVGADPRPAWMQSIQLGLLRTRPERPCSRRASKRVVSRDPL
jgi:hypothetical protein